MATQRKHIAELIQQNEKTNLENLQLRLKVKSMAGIIQLAVDEQQFLQIDNEQTIDQLATENENLRRLLKISDYFQNDLNVDVVRRAIDDQEKKLQEVELDKLQKEEQKKTQDLELFKSIMTQEIDEQLRRQYDEKFQALAEETAHIVQMSKRKPQNQDEEIQIIMDSPKEEAKYQTTSILKDELQQEAYAEVIVSSKSTDRSSKARSQTQVLAEEEATAIESEFPEFNQLFAG